MAMTPREIWNRAALAYGFIMADDQEAVVEERMLRSRYKGKEKDLERRMRRVMVETELTTFQEALREVLRGK